jgi:hypothetical protein
VGDDTSIIGTPKRWCASIISKLFIRVASRDPPPISQVGLSKASLGDPEDGRRNGPPEAVRT